ncbi:MAG: hypothetical protein IT378_23940 [Sandaracinaceae bacterium]|nr:hypothetical protein [Sandaracinaceae bacterium]
MVALVWKERPTSTALDFDRVTELGAEAVALALVHETRGWTVARRMQKTEHADWLMSDPATNRKVAFEISGTATSSLTSRVTEKLRQVAECFVPRRTVCVVRFQEPRARLVDWR